MRQRRHDVGGAAGAAADEAGHVPVVIGAQTCLSADAGPYTGEVSAQMVASLNVAYVIAGT
jgi:triosephosphate isomerase